MPVGLLHCGYPKYPTIAGEESMPCIGMNIVTHLENDQLNKPNTRNS